MPTAKKSSKDRVQKWREGLRARGGKEVRLALEKRSVDHLERVATVLWGHNLWRRCCPGLERTGQAENTLQTCLRLEGKRSGC